MASSMLIHVHNEVPYLADGTALGIGDSVEFGKGRLHFVAISEGPCFVRTDASGKVSYTCPLSQDGEYVFDGQGGRRILTELEELHRRIVEYFERRHEFPPRIREMQKGESLKGQEVKEERDGERFVQRWRSDGTLQSSNEETTRDRRWRLETRDITITNATWAIDTVDAPSRRDIEVVAIWPGCTFQEIKAQLARWS